MRWLLIVSMGLLNDWQTSLLFLWLIIFLTLSVDPKRNAKRAYSVEVKFSWDRRMTLVEKIIIIIIDFTFPENYLVHRYTCTHTHTHPFYYCVRCVLFICITYVIGFVLINTQATPLGLSRAKTTTYYSFTYKAVLEEAVTPCIFCTSLQ